jgi:hypothetical protein
VQSPQAPRLLLDSRETGVSRYFVHHGLTPARASLWIRRIPYNNKKPGFSQETGFLISLCSFYA